MSIAETVRNHLIGQKVICVSNERDDQMIYGKLTGFMDMKSGKVPIITDEAGKEWFVMGIILPDSANMRAAIKALEDAGLKGRPLWHFLSHVVGFHSDIRASCEGE